MQEEREATDAPPSLEEGPSSGVGEEALVKAAPAAVTRWADYCFDVRDVTYDNRVVLLRDGRDAFPAMLNAIDSAERSVCLETYILEQDVMGRRFADALIRAASRGVACALLFDAVGSPSLSDEFIEGMTAAGVHVRAFRPLTARAPFRYLIRRDHRKVLVVDDAAAFVGGINIHDPAAAVEEGGHGWHDFAVRVEGPAVSQLASLFDESWRLAGRRVLRRRRRPVLPARVVPQPSGDVPLQVVATDNIRGRWAIRRSMLYAISRARQSVLVANAYFVPDPGVVRALTAAAKRGVDVNILVPERSDVPVVDYVRGAFYDRLLKHGVRVHHWVEGVLHAKVAVVDDTWATVGSYNLDWMSLLRNMECVVNVLDPGFARQLGDSLRADIARSDEIVLDRWLRRSFLRRWIFEPFLYLFRRYL